MTRQISETQNDDLLSEASIEIDALTESLSQRDLEIAELKNQLSVKKSEDGRKEKIRAAKGNSECAKRISIASTAILQAKAIREKQNQMREILLAAGMDEKDVSLAISTGVVGAISLEKDAQRNLLSVINAIAKVIDPLKDEKDLGKLLKITRELWDSLSHLIPEISSMRK